MVKDRSIKEQENKKNRDAVLAGAANETVQRYGSAAKEHLVAYSGIDNESGKTLKKSLKKISDYKLNEKYYETNIKQQAGFSAEVKTTARRNAENIIKRDSIRVSRTDDLGRVNDPLYDLINIDSQGNVIDGTGSQMKFVGASPAKLLDQLCKVKFKKYIDADVLLDIADDDYDALMGVGGKSGLIEDKISKLEEQLNRLQKEGKAEAASKKIEQIEKLKKIKKNLRKTGMTRNEAIEARLTPEKSTAKDIGKIAHKSGVEQAQMGATISSAISLVKNTVAYIKGEKTAEEAAKGVVLDTSSGAVVSYATAFSGSIVKSHLQNSTSITLRATSKTNLPTRLVSTTLNVGRTMSSFVKGDINGLECIERLGQDGFAEISSAMFATVGASLARESIALGIVSGIVGSTVGYAAAVAVYQELSSALKEEKLAHEERLRIEEECQESILLIEQYRNEMHVLVREYLSDHIDTFTDGFLAMDKAICENDIDGFIKGNLQIQSLFNYEMQYKTQKEFDELMLSDEVFKL